MDATAKVRCPNCKIESGAQAELCYNCGAALHGGSATATSGGAASAQPAGFGRTAAYGLQVSNDYDPTSIRKMASILGTVATTTVVLFAIAGVVTAFAIMVAGSQFGSDGGALSFWVGLLYGGLTFGVGYLIALLIRVVAQLMLAVIQIESNTRTQI